MKVDMSAKAVSERLKRVSQLNRLCLSLKNTKPIPSQELNKTDQPDDLLKTGKS